mmetsp:Transcript_5742/g.9410  ORF Transcript_5742/g.9410 Transcript_5742/m.9410 type:complete len:101 (+) Transcript_5742:306-608(+)
MGLTTKIRAVQLLTRKTLITLFIIFLVSPSSPELQTKPVHKMTMKPTDNDVLSGRGAWFNQHPGNQHFRKILDDQKVSGPQLHCPRLPFDSLLTNVYSYL